MLLVPAEHKKFQLAVNKKGEYEGKHGELDGRIG
jgi:hypothetical protein